MKKIIIRSSFLIIILSMISCLEETKMVWIDNPSDKPIIVKLNEEVFEIAPKTQVSKNVKFGNVALTVNDSQVKRVHLDGDKDYLLNPLEYTYYIHKVMFFENPEKEKRYYRDHEQKYSKVGGFSVSGDYTRIDSTIAIPKTWSLGLDKPMRKTFRTNRYYGDEDFVYISKIYRSEELLNQLLKGYIKQ